MKYITFFDEIWLKDSPVFGGKTASLGEMTQAHIPVPSGFGISIEAHGEFKKTDFSPEFMAELRASFKKLGAERVAVRSSAVAEDSLDASWAGQLETYLNVTEDNLEESIRDCWRSVEASHVQDYAKDKTLSRDSLLVGVAVQTMVNSELAGVMFTVNPVSKNPDEILIEGAYGLGEMVVQAIVTPDNFHVSKKSLEVTQYTINIKQHMMVYKDATNQTTPVPESMADRAILREKQIQELATIGILVEKYFKTPQDIEWAYANNTFYIVQARPITTL